MVTQISQYSQYCLNPSLKFFLSANRNFLTYFTAWRSQALWIAGKATGSYWRWYGRITSTLSTSNSVWYPSHPYNSRSNFCVAFYAGYNGIIQRECSTIYTYYPMCERPPTSCPPNYVRSPITNTCLGVTQQGMNWHQAKAHCEGKGQKLAVLDTKAAFDWLKTYSNGKGNPCLNFILEFRTNVLFVTKPG